MKRKVIFIAGLARSGTTFLQLRLAAHSGVVALGEIYQTIDGLLVDESDARKFVWRDISKRSCSCGSGVDDCEFWSPIKRYSESNCSAEQLHKKIMDRSRKLYGDSVIIDSSKDVRALKNYYHSEEYELKVLYIIRDFRGWIPSVQKHRARVGLANYGYIFDAYLWLWSTARQVRFFKQSRYDVCFISYEKLIFEYDREMASVKNFLELGEGEIGHNVVAHDVWGSTFKNIQGADSTLKYDYGWMSSLKGVCYAALIFPVYIFNKYVYEKLR